MKLILIATLSLGTCAWAQAVGSNMQSADNDWYNQHLSAQVQEFNRIAAATAPAIAINESTQPASMASNQGSQAGEDWYNQVHARAVVQFNRVGAAAAPSTPVPFK